MVIKLGQKVKDSITDFEGIVFSRTCYLNGCVRMEIIPKVDKDGLLTESQFFDEDQLVVVDDGVMKVEKPKPKSGPVRDNPSLYNNPRGL